MLKLGFEPQKIISFNKSILLPALVVGAFFTYFSAITEFTDTAYYTIHWVFLSSVIVSLLILGYLKIFSATISVSIIYISYLIINNLRYIYGEDYMFSAGYNVWTFLLMPNLCLSYFIFHKPGAHKYWSWFYIFLFAQSAIIEKIQTHNIDTDSYYFYKNIGMINYPTLLSSVVCIIILFCYHVARGRILSAGAMFSSIAVFAGVYLSDNLFAYGLFFSAGVLVWLVDSLYYVNYSRYKDEDLGISSCRAFFNDAENKYPLKYSIVLMYIDEYERLIKRFGKRKMILLKKMFLKRIADVDKGVIVYNYRADAFILVFTNANATEGFERAEEIRRTLAKSIFVFNESNHLQLTVSQCVSEKKRSDANASVVLQRAEENLQKVCKFTRNITVKN